MLKMKSISKISILIILTGLVSCSQNSFYQIDWLNQNEEPNKVLSYYDHESKIAYDITNDNENLYLEFLVIDESAQRQIMMSGMQVWLDTTKKQKENFGLFFPLKTSPNLNRPKEQSSDEQPPKIEDMKLMYLASQTKYKTVSLAGYKNGLHDLTNGQGLSTSLGFDENGSMVYNAIVPLTCLNINTLTSVDSTAIFSMLIKVPGVELPNGGQGGPPGGGGGPGGPPPGGGGPPGGGRGGPPNGQGGGPSGMADLTNDKIIKVRYKLRLKNS
jgi:hypothetical protein